MRIEKKCLVCGKTFFTIKSRADTAKYCSVECSNSAQKGVQKPHSKEHEEKRLAAIRKSNEGRVFKSGYKRPTEHTKAMRDARNKAEKADPDKYREIALKNLSKNKDGNVSKENSPNWKGGITKNINVWRNENRGRLEEHRKIVLERDGYKCKQCGSTKNLQVHHIITILECREAAFLPMNGVTLCDKCHKQTDNFGGAASRLTKIEPSCIGGKIITIGRTIPHCFQAYNTVGNYQWTKNGILIIFVSELGNEQYNQLVFIHEIIEATLCEKLGIKEEDITNFDLYFEKRREMSLVEEFAEAGDDINSPYHKEHVLATSVERMLCEKMGLDWNQYSATINEL